jgi:zinc transport system ATP-binding protein
MFDATDPMAPGQAAAAGEAAERPAPSSSDGEVLLRCEKLVVGYGGHALLPPIELELRRGWFVVLLGRNGSGKTTLLRTLLGLLPPVRGSVQRVQPGLRLAYVPQTSGLDELLPLRARDVVAQGQLRGWGFLWPWATGADHRARERALHEADAVAFAHRPLRELSRGQRQRVLFARMLASGADLVLLDEPTAAMDLLAEQSSVELLVRLARERSMTVVMASHAIEATTARADRALLVDPGAGVVLFDRPERVAEHELYRRHFPRAEPNHAD